MDLGEGFLAGQEEYCGRVHSTVLRSSGGSWADAMRCLGWTFPSSSITGPWTAVGRQ